MILLKKWLISLFVICICCATLAVAQPFHSFSSFVNPDCAQQEKRDNEFSYNGKPRGDFFCNPLVLDGQPFQFRNFTLKSKGELRLIKGEPATGKAVDIPFFLHLRRNGILIPHLCGDKIIFTKIEISMILKLALDGDELIIEPVNQEDWPAKRIVDIRGGC
jgi:hypothetical protein